MAFDLSARLGPLTVKHWLIGAGVFAVVVIIIGVVLGVTLAALPADEEGSPADEEDSPADEEDSPADEEDSPADEEDSPADEEKSAGSPAYTDLPEYDMPSTLKPTVQKNGADQFEGTFGYGETYTQYSSPTTFDGAELSSALAGTTLSYMYSYTDGGTTYLFVRVTNADMVESFALISPFDFIIKTKDDVSGIDDPASYTGTWQYVTSSGTAPATYTVSFA